MIPGSFDYFRPVTFDELFSLQATHGMDAQLLAGGHTLLPMMKLRLATPGVLIDLAGIDSLRQVLAESHGTEVGAMTTHASVGRDPRLGGARAVIRDAAAVIADPMVRNRGTVGGSLACADAASDWPAVMLSLDASLQLASKAGTRTLPLASFYQGFMTTALEEGEVLCSIRIPPALQGECSAYEKLKHPASGLAVVGVAVVLQVEGSAIRSARVAITGATESPTRLHEVEALLAGRPATEEAFKQAAQAARKLDSPINDRFASSDYRCHLATVFTKRALVRALLDLDSRRK